MLLWLILIYTIINNINFEIIADLKIFLLL